VDVAPVTTTSPRQRNNIKHCSSIGKIAGIAIFMPEQGMDNTIYAIANHRKSYSPILNWERESIPWFDVASIHSISFGEQGDTATVI